MSEVEIWSVVGLVAGWIRQQMRSSGVEIVGKSIGLSSVKLCPNCARQGQIFPKNSRRNQKCLWETEFNQDVEITPFLYENNTGLKIPRMVTSVPVRFRSRVPVISRS